MCVIVLLVALLAGCGSEAAPAASSAPAAEESQAVEETAAPLGDPIKIGIPDDATNGGRAIKLLESAGLIEVDPAAGWVPELKDVTNHLYNIEIVPTQANTLPSTLDDFGAATINGTYAIPTGLVPSRDGLLIESRADATGESGNPFVNVIVARSADKDNEVYQTIVEAFQTDVVGQYLIGKYQEAFIPAFDYSNTDKSNEELVAEIDAYKSSADGKAVVKVGVCGASNDHWKAVQKVLDDNCANIYIELVEFDAYNLGAHVSTPEQGVDAAYIASQIVVAGQALVTRRTSPMDNVLIGIGRISAGTAYNVVAQEAELEGTIRVFTPEIRKQTKARLETLAKSIAEVYGGTAEVEWKDFTSPLINDPVATDEAQKIAASLFGGEKVIRQRRPELGGDDFAEYILRAPGAYAYVGSGNPEKPNTRLAHHNSRFDIDEDCLKVSVALSSCYAIEYLNGEA